MSIEHDPPELTTVWRKCSLCKGKGTVPRQVVARPWSDDPYDTQDVTCPKCGGDKEVPKSVCSSCERPEYSDYEAACDCWQRKEDGLDDVLELAS